MYANNGLSNNVDDNNIEIVFERVSLDIKRIIDVAKMTPIALIPKSNKIACLTDKLAINNGSS